MGSPQWFTTMCKHSGQELAIRLRPPAVVADARKVYPHLFVIIHSLSRVRADGMPAPDYNESLFPFDCELIHQLEIDGRVVLVETYAGERIYYAYVADEVVSKARVTSVLNEYGHLLESSFRGGADPEWEFYDEYNANMVSTP